MPAVLRPATPADHDAIVALDRLVFPDARDEFDVASVFAAPAVVRDTQYFPVVEADGDLLGFAFLAMSKATIESHPSEPLVADPLTAELVRLVVHPGARGQGIATTLVDVVAQAAAETGYRQVVAQATEAGARRLAAAGWALTAQGGYKSWSADGAELLPPMPAGEVTLRFTPGADRFVASGTFDAGTVAQYRRARLENEPR